MPILRDVFISHSHHDRKAVANLATRLKESFEIYVDLDDPLLAETPSNEIASRLLTELERSRILLVVLSVKSMRSRWIPWELGLAHGRIGRILLWPLSQAAMRALRIQEYLNLYEVADAENPMTSLQEMVDAARRELVPDSTREALRIAGAHLADAHHFLPPSEIPVAATGAATDMSSNYTIGAFGQRRK